MYTSMECLPCLIRQSLGALKLASISEADQEKIMRRVLKKLSEFDLRQSPPVMTDSIHALIREITGVEDPYREIKTRLNQAVLGIFPHLQELVNASDDPFATALSLAAAGNALDLGANGDIDEKDVLRAVDDALAVPIQGDVEALRSAVLQASQIVYLADNAGEIVFDKLLIEQLGNAHISLVVRGKPVLNDVVLEDALSIGMQQVAEVIDNGSGAAGTVLADCSAEFLKRFNQADLVIAKGQGNYESLNSISARIFFIFKVKCAVMRDLVKQPVGTKLLIEIDQGKIVRTK